MMLNQLLLLVCALALSALFLLVSIGLGWPLSEIMGIVIVLGLVIEVVRLHRERGQRDRD